jgi:hypothetical protein
MSIVGDDTHTQGQRGRPEQLWQTPAPTHLRSVPAVVTPTSPNTPTHPALVTHLTGGDELWQARIDLVVSSGLSGDAARQAGEDAGRQRARAAFDALCRRCRHELRPVLECSAEMLQEWGIEANVTETLRDEPARLPRSFDLALRIDAVGHRGPGKLVITTTEGCDFVRVKVAVGPSKAGADVNEHVGTTIAGDLSDALVGGLVATLVEKIFNP